MRRTIIYSVMVVGFLCLGLNARAQEKPVKFKNDYYNTRIAAHQAEGLQKNAIIFIGNSITEQGWWRILFNRKDIENRGIGGDNTFGMLDRFADILRSQPQAIFLMAGVNDITAGRDIDTIAYNVAQMVKMAKDIAPKCKFYIQSVLPLNDSRLAYPSIKGKNPVVCELNERYKALCKKEGVEYIDIATLMMDKNGQLKLEFTKDGIHLHPEAYEIWAAYLMKNNYIKR